VYETANSHNYHQPNDNTRSTTSFPAQPGLAGTRKGEPLWILVKQEMMESSGISCTISICTSLQIDNHTSTPSLNLLTVRMLFLPPKQTVGEVNFR